MKIFTLPDYFGIKPTAQVALHDYHSFQSIHKSKITLSNNTFSFLREGTKEIITEKKSVKIENDKFLIIKSGNCLMTENLSENRKTYRSILFFFSDEMILSFLEKNDFNFRRQKTTTPYLTCDYDDYILNFVKSLEGILKMKPGLQRKILQAKFEEIMFYLVQLNGEDFLGSILMNQDNRTAKLTNVVENNKLNKLTLQELSFLCNMSLSTFKREFQKQYEETPIKWFQDKRLEHSAFLLKTKKLRPNELYMDAGYESLSSFVQAFKNKYGTTPKQFQMTTA